MEDTGNIKGGKLRGNSGKNDSFEVGLFPCLGNVCLIMIYLPEL